MAGRDATEPPSASQGASQGTSRSNKRKFKEVYDPSHSELFPEEPWYHLNYRNIIDSVHEMMDEITIPLEKYVGTDTGIANLVNDSVKVKELPDLKQCRVAVLGEQASGKSTVGTALFGGRQLFERSGGGASCTQIPTELKQKRGAADDTRFSDLLVEWLSEEQRMAYIWEHILRWTEVYPGTQNAQPSSEDDTNMEDDTSESETEQDTQQRPKQGKVPKAQRGAFTANEFFKTIFNVDGDPVAKKELEHRLYHTDIRQGSFEGLCLQKVTERFEQLRTELNIKDNVSEFRDVHDRELPRKRSLIKKLWPFVKVFTIATGHILLRYGICFYDLPGFGDPNQIRAAHINNFRWQADLELIVAECSRIRTSETLEGHLRQSIHLKGANRTVLIMNKSDELLDSQVFGEQIRDIDEDPFHSLRARLAEVETRTENLFGRMEEEDYVENEDNDSERCYLKDELDLLFKESTLAYIEYETRLVKEQMQDKGIAIYSASAQSYLEWMNRMREDDPVLDPASSGIPAIIRFFLGVPAATNLRNYRDHVTKVLPAWRKRAARVIQKHTEDKQYAKMRQDLARNIPLLRNQLEQAVDLQLQHAIVEPWNDCGKPKIAEGIKDLFETQWVHPHIKYNGFAKMLQENGIPVNGKYFGRNLNEDVLGPVAPPINDWADTMKQRAETLAISVNQPVQEFLDTIRACIDTCTAEPLLKDAAVEALKYTRDDIESAYGTFLERAQRSLDENHLRYTTEMDVECPIARAMKPRYQRAREPRFTGTGKGIYNRQRKFLSESMLKPSYHYPKLSRDEERIKPLIDDLKEQLVNRQRDLWKSDCMKFIQEAIEHLEVFSGTTEELLMDEEFMSEAYKEAREVLGKLLVQFDRNLAEIRAEFDELESQHPAKKIKVEESEDNGPSATPAEPLRQDPDPATVQEEASVPIDQGIGLRD